MIRRGRVFIGLVIFCAALVGCHGPGTPPHSYTANIQGGVQPQNDATVLTELKNELGPPWTGTSVWVVAQEVCSWQAQNLKNWFAARGHFTLFKAQKLAAGCSSGPGALNPQKGLLIAHHIEPGYYPAYKVHVFPDSIQTSEDLGNGERRQALCANEPGNGEWGCATHLTTDANTAGSQNNNLRAWIAGNGLGGVPTVVGGDFNVDPDHGAISNLNGKLRPVG